MKSISQITDIIIIAIVVQYLEVNLYIGNCLNLMDVTEPAKMMFYGIPDLPCNFKAV